MPQPSPLSFISLFALATLILPLQAHAVQTQQSNLIRSVVLDAPSDQPALIDALAGVRGRPLSAELRSVTYQRLASAVDRLGWTNVQITVPAQLPANGRWLLRVAGTLPPVAPTAVGGALAQHPAVAHSASYSPTLQEWRADATARVLIVRSSHQLYAKFGDVVERFPVAVGRRSNQTPLGRYMVQNIAHKPTWFPTKRMRVSAQQRGRKLPKRVPPGPGNPLGDWFVALGYSIGIHGNNSPWSIGRSVSSGCIRMRNADIERLARSVLAGDGVWIVDTLEPAVPITATPGQVAASKAGMRAARAPLQAGIATSIGPVSP